MAAKIQDRLHIARVELISGDRGEFSIWVGAVCVAQKTDAGFPTEDSVLEAAQAALR